MTNLLKTFGKGCLYILVFPILLVILAVYIVLGLVIFIYIGIKGTILFFSGRNLAELPEDIKAREILDKEKADLEAPQPVETVEEPLNNSYASHYYVPLDQSIPAPKEARMDETENNEVKEEKNED